jgi:hypothetical protein
LSNVLLDPDGIKCPTLYRWYKMPKLAQIALVGVEENPALIGSTQIKPKTILTSSEFAQIVPVGVEEVLDLIEKMLNTQLLLELGQISSDNVQTTTQGEMYASAGVLALT